MRPARQIARVLAPQPPYAVPAPAFSFPALAALAGRAPLGGARETVLALFVVARLVRDAAGPDPIPPSIRATRAAATRAWLTALALPTSVRPAMHRLVDATASDDARALRTALTAVTGVTAPYLDQAASLEIQHLGEAVAA